MANSGHFSFMDVAKELRSAHVATELRTAWSFTVLYRVVSLPISWACLRAGYSPTSISLVGLLVALIAPFAALYLPLGWAPLAVFLSGALFQVLDCSDGTVARMSGKTSILGADLDYFFDIFQHILLYTAIGILADRVLGTAGLWAALGATGASLRLMARLIREQVATRVPQTQPGPFKISELPIAFLSGLTGLIPFGALAGQYTGYVVIALIVYSVADIVDAAMPMTKAPYR
nr:CDP-alcohol phosphatidyltransferase family protein [uncultured Shimia sp.]